MLSKYKPQQQDWQIIEQKMTKAHPSLAVVIGDCGLDHYVFGHVTRICPEAPVPVLEFSEETYQLGLAANVATNVTAAGFKCHLVGAVGSDPAGELMKKLLNDHGISFLLATDQSRPTIVKTRFIAGHHMLLRVDQEKKHNLSNQFYEWFEDNLLGLTAPSVVIVQDYKKGLLNRAFYEKIIDWANKIHVGVLVDPYQSREASFYEGCLLLKPNWEEALSLLGLPKDTPKNEKNIFDVGLQLKAQTKSSIVVITLGKDGMALFDEQYPTGIVIPAFTQDVFDVTGAGDTVIAYLAAGLMANLSTLHAVLLANAAAAYAVSKVGCVATPLPEALKRLKLNLS